MLPEVITRNAHLLPYLEGPEREELATLLAEHVEKDEAQTAQDSLAAYIRQAWHVIEPSTAYLHNWHIDCICDHLQAVSKGQITRLVINIPPRYMKSICVTIMWPTWEWGPCAKPWLRWLFASYSGELSIKHSVDRRAIIESPWYKRNWGNTVKLASDQNVKSEYLNTRRGVMVATSVGGSATGKGGGRIVVDDPHNPLQAESEAERKRGIEFFDKTLSTRLDDKHSGAIVVVMQRLHDGDLSAHCLKELGYHHLKIQGLADEATTIHFPLSGQIKSRDIDDVLWEARENAEMLATQKKVLGSYGFAGQYQQNPTPPEGGLAKRHWWKFYDPAELHSGKLTFDEIIQSWDMAFDKTDTSSFVTCGIWGRKGACKYLLDQLRRRMDFTETLEQVKHYSLKWPKATAKIVENKANGPAIINALKKTVTGLIPMQPMGSKEARAQAVSPEIEAGNVFLPDKTKVPWVDDYIEEWAAAPFGKFWDQIDQTTQALIRFQSATPTNLTIPNLGGSSKWRKPNA